MNLEDAIRKRILNLAKEGNLQIKQDKNLDEIVLSIKGEV